MKVKFNLPVHRYNSKITFDNNTTLGIGNLQPLFCKFVLPKSKFSCNLAQLTRLSPLVVPTFARLKQVNDFIYIPMNKLFPAFDSFMSSTPINGTSRSYTPSSVPCTSNRSLFLQLIEHYAWVNSYKASDYSSIGKHFGFYDFYRNQVVSTTSKVLPKEKLLAVKSDFTFTDLIDSSRTVLVKLTQDGRFWYTVLRGLGYTCDITDERPVSVLPLLAFAKAYYDVYYPKRFNSWHSSNYYDIINDIYNGDFKDWSYAGHKYIGVKANLLCSLFGNDYSFFAYGVLDNDVINACLSTPLNKTLPTVENYNLYGNDGAISSFGTYSDQAINKWSATPGTLIQTAPDPSGSNGEGSAFVDAASLSLADRLWHFVSRSSVVGQSVKDWFKVHFGTSPSEDMFESSVCFAQKPNLISINSVVSTADTANNGGSQLGDLAGQGFSTTQDKVSFDVPSFGFIMCLSGIVPQSRVSGGTQPELYKTQYFDMPFPDFDGLGYEVLNQSSFVDNSLSGSTPASASQKYDGGFGFVPSLTSFKTLNNFRSGCFALPSLIDQYLPYCEDSVIDFRGSDLAPLPSASNLKSFFPWRYVGNFVSYNRIFYNQFTRDSDIEQFYIDDNFMCQTSFELDLSSYLKPISDSYSIESLGKQIVSVKRQ